MALPFLKNGNKSLDQLVSVDLGGRTTKAVHMQRKGDGLALCGFAVLDAPLSDKSISVDLLAEHIKAIGQALGITKAKPVSLAVGVNESLVRLTELPQMPVGDMRLILKNNSKNYLQQDLVGYVFDCFIFASRANGAPAKDKNAPASMVQKHRVLAAGMKKQMVDDLQAAIRNSGLIADRVVPGVIGPVNAFEMAQPNEFEKGVIALVDIGFKNSTICILQEGELMLNRVVAIGGDRLTAGLAETMNISYGEAEGIKIGMPEEVQANLEPLIIPLGRELRASIDFFEHQHDKVVSQVFISGGSARSDFIVKLLQTELLVDCKPWNPASFLQMALPPQQTTEIDVVAPQLTVAIGSALAAF
ncbi:MAG TPA: pilus assembly protein PilM [Verrucomicrobiae bacterium]|nr:pilus assembly protein PilM [Verrucomicrobiae bacterium]